MKTFVYNHHHVINHPFDLAPTVQDAEAVIFWNDFHFTRQVQNASKHAKTLLYQHGRYALQDYYLNNHPVSTHGVLTWGESERKKMIDWGYPEDKILAIGNPMYEKIYHHEPEDYFVLVGLHWVRDVAEINSWAIDRVLEALPKGTRLVFKTMKKVKIARPLPEGVEIAETNIESQESARESVLTLKHAKGVITLCESTFELYARFMGLPVIQLESAVVQDKFGQVKLADMRRPYTRRFKSSELKEALANVEDYVATGWEDEVLIPALPVEDIYKFIKKL